MNKSQLVRAVSESTHSSRRTVEDVVDVLFDTIVTEVRSGRKVTVVGFGTFTPTDSWPPCGSKSSDWCSGTDPGVERCPVRHRFDVQIGVEP